MRSTPLRFITVICPRVRNQSSFSESVQSFRYAGPPDAKHERQKLVRERQLVVPYAIMLGQCASELPAASIGGAMCWSDLLVP
jgi:hypothetical protein